MQISKGTFLSRGHYNVRYPGADKGRWGHYNAVKRGVWTIIMQVTGGSIITQISEGEVSGRRYNAGKRADGGIITLATRGDSESGTL